MATGFDHREICEEAGCNEEADLTYNEKTKLCKGCAMKRAGPSWRCDFHQDKEVDLYCKDHDKVICNLCAIGDHKICEMVDLQQAISEKKEELTGLKGRMEGDTTSWNNYISTLRDCQTSTVKHLCSLEKWIIALSESETERENRREESEKDVINEEADKEILRINKKRESRLEQTYMDAERRRQMINDTKRELIDELKDISEKTQAKIDELHKEAEDAMSVIEKAGQKIDSLLQNDKDLVFGAHELTLSLQDMFEICQDRDMVDGIIETVLGVQFVRGKKNDTVIGKLIGYNTDWDNYDALPIPELIKKPRIVGHIDDDNVIVRENTTGDIYTINLANKQVSQVKLADGKCISNCVSLNENTIISGNYVNKYCGDKLLDCISVYDRKWRLITDISIPRNTPHEQTSVYVVATTGGMILAAEEGQKMAYLIKDCQIIREIECADDLWLRDAKSDGSILAGISDGVVLISFNTRGCSYGFSMQGFNLEQRCQNWKNYNFAIDRRTNDVFVLTWEAASHKFKISTVVFREWLERRETQRHTSLRARMVGTTHRSVDIGRIVSEFAPINDTDGNDELGPNFISKSRMILTSKGKLVFCNGRDFIILMKRIQFKKAEQISGSTGTSSGLMSS